MRMDTGPADGSVYTYLWVFPEDEPWLLVPLD